MLTIYYCDAPNFEGYFEKGLSFLPRERQEKAERFLRTEDRVLSVLTGLMLQKVLGYSETKPLRFFEHGKPYMDNAPCFSISHSGDLAVLAVSEYPIGVDVQKAVPFSKNLLRRSFTEEEQDYIGEDPVRFLRLWTRKEAAIKLTGDGLSVPLQSFSVFPEGKKVTVSGKEFFIQTEEWEKAVFSVTSLQKGEPIAIREFYPEDFFDKGEDP